MNLTLGFDGLEDPRLAVAAVSNVESTVARFRERMQDPNSPIREIRLQPARKAEYSPIPDSVEPKLRRAIESRGIAQLYSHQRAAWDSVQAGNNTVIVTPTASGKTLCYNLPVWHKMLSEPEARAFYLFPTKALAEDQLAEFHSAVEAMDSGIRAFTYDGDTPQDARKAIRERANVILTNPDMLHAGILPHHTKWARCFENLQYIVLDELHYYRGVYGSHFANILRRLRRICEFHGSHPKFICSSATIANPRELAETLTGEPFHLIDSNGAPSGEKYFVFYNPPVVNRQLGIRRSYLHESRRIARELIERGQQTLVFANNRLATEVLVTYLKDDCAKMPMGADGVRGYRGGYLPRERREIERKLREGSIRAVVSTNALELGIDVGGLDGVVMAGYPGAIASTWQRAGRAGRRQTTAVAVLVASSNPVDQYIVEHPDYFFSQAPEQAHINPDNLEILLSHLKCAAFELPLRDDETFGKHNVAKLCEFLVELNLLHKSGDAWHWTSDTYPADAISLRSVSSDNFIVIDETSEPTVIAEVAFTAAPGELHEKAIYLHEARQFQVERLDFENRKAYVRRVECDYYTDAIDYTQVKELDQFESSPMAGAIARHGEVRVNTQIVGFKKIKFYTNENIGAGQLTLPEQEMHTTAFWLHFPAEFLAQFSELTPTDRQSGLVGIAAAMRAVAALALMSDPRDIGYAITEDIVSSLEKWEPDLFLYDSYPGGAGLSAPLFRLRNKLVELSAQLISACQCENGCPSCVGPAGETGGRGKEAAVRILRALMEPTSVS
jgi:DEAD/DEAH box helicase domain-containing protein